MRKTLWRTSLQFVADKAGWQIAAWVVLSNHYHILLHAPRSDASRLSSRIGSLHRFTARRWNDEDRTPSRQVGWNYWDTCITSEAAYCARFNYIHWNPVKHGLVSVPDGYAFSSYREFFAADQDALRRIERSFSFDHVQIPDDF